MSTRPIAMRPYRSIGLVGCLVAARTRTQFGHSAKGAWSGYRGPGESGQRRVLLLLDWTENELRGTINPGPNGVAVDRVE